MYYSTDPDTRQAYIAGLRGLAGYLEANPGVPVPGHGTEILLIASLAEDGGTAEITDIADQLSTPVTDATEDLGSYFTVRSFGPVSYKAVSHTKTSVAVHRAERSYVGCITPDEVTSDA